MVHLNQKSWFVRQKVLGANIHETEGLLERNVASFFCSLFLFLCLSLSLSLSLCPSLSLSFSVSLAFFISLSLSLPLALLLSLSLSLSLALSFSHTRALPPSLSLSLFLALSCSLSLFLSVTGFFYLLCAFASSQTRLPSCFFLCLFIKLPHWAANPPEKLRTHTSGAQLGSRVWLSSGLQVLNIWWIYVHGSTPMRLEHNMILISQGKSTEYSNLLTFWTHPDLKTACAMPNTICFCGRNTVFLGSCHCAAVLFSQVPKKCADLHLSLLYKLVLVHWCSGGAIVLRVCEAAY